MGKEDDTKMLTSFMTMCGNFFLSCSRWISDSIFNARVTTRTSRWKAPHQSYLRLIQAFMPPKGCMPCVSLNLMLSQNISGRHSDASRSLKFAHWQRFGQRELNRVLFDHPPESFSEIGHQTHTKHHIIANPLAPSLTSSLEDGKRLQISSSSREVPFLKSSIEFR
eukprot:368846-Hanusia_phi.AAC.4